MAARKQKAAGAVSTPVKPKGPPRQRRPWLESQATVGQLVRALASLGHDIDPEVLRKAYYQHGNRKVAKENDPAWLQAQLERVTGKAALLVPPRANHYIEPGVGEVSYGTGETSPDA